MTETRLTMSPACCPFCKGRTRRGCSTTRSLVFMICSAEHSEQPMREAGLKLLAAAPSEQFSKSVSAPAIALSNWPAPWGRRAKCWGSISRKACGRVAETRRARATCRSGRATVRRCGTASLRVGDHRRHLHQFHAGAVRYARITESAGRMEASAQTRRKTGHRCDFQGRQAGAGDRGVRMDASPFPELDGLPPDLRRSCAGSGGVSRGRKANRTHVGAGRNRKATKAN